VKKPRARDSGEEETWVRIPDAGPSTPSVLQKNTSRFLDVTPKNEESWVQLPTGVHTVDNENRSHSGTLPEGGGMIAKYRFRFVEPTEVGFIDPDTMKRQWYTCYYERGTTLEVADLLSGNLRHIFAFCTDGEVVFVDTEVVRIESLR
jgi:hypothetical protein